MAPEMILVKGLWAVIALIWMGSSLVSMIGIRYRQAALFGVFAILSAGISWAM